MVLVAVERLCEGDAEVAEALVSALGFEGGGRGKGREEGLLACLGLDA